MNRRRFVASTAALAALTPVIGPYASDETAKEHGIRVLSDETRQLTIRIPKMILEETPSGNLIDALCTMWETTDKAQVERFLGGFGDTIIWEWGDYNDMVELSVHQTEDMEGRPVGAPVDLT